MSHQAPQATLVPALFANRQQAEVASTELAGAGALLWGGVIGGLVGVITRVRRPREQDCWCEVELGGDDVLVAVRVQDWSQEDKIAAALSQAGAPAVLDQFALDKDWHQLELEHPSRQSPPPARRVPA